jgi:hypothetical protein
MSKKWDTPYIENSAGLILPPEVQERFVRQYGWTKSGHRDVIRLGNQNPAFALEFQIELLKVRNKFINDNPSFIFDRSPVDNLAYFLLQCGHLSTNDAAREHIENCIKAAKKLDGIIFLHTSTNHEEIENNGSRVDNWYYQLMVTAVFKHVMETYMKHVESIEITTWDYATRQRLITNFIA